MSKLDDAIAGTSSSVPLSGTGARYYLPGDSIPMYPVPAPKAETSAGVMLQVLARISGDPTIDLDRVERILALHEKLAARDAAREYTEAMAHFKSKPLTIRKDKLVSFQTQKGRTEYRHATIGAVCEAIIPGLADVGISHHWELERKEARVIVTCVLTHRAGHSTRTTWDGPPDDSGQKNVLQQAASTITYLQRYTLLSATGIGVSESDDDGNAGGEDSGGAEAPDGYENWSADMDAITDWPTLEAAWAKSNGIFKGWAVAADAKWWETRKASAKAGLSTGDYLRTRAGA